MAKKKASEILEDAITEAAVEHIIDANLSTGSSMLDLGISGSIGRAFGPGHYTLFVGDSGSGKTFLLLTCFAEAASMPEYDDYKLLYVCSENGAQMDFHRFFGKKAASRIEIVRPETLERMYDMFDKLAEEKTKYIAVVDSTDGMATESELKGIKENAKLREQGKDTKGSYGDGKAKIHSSRLKTVIHHLEKNGCILAIISQTRDNIDAGMFEEQKTRSGGHALKFYAHSEVWLTCGGAITKEVRGKKRILGRYANCKVKKNRVNGRERTVRVPILPSVGIDDTGSMLDWLIEESFLKSSGGRYSNPWYDKTYTKEELIRKLETDDRIGDLKAYTQQCWDEIEEACNVERKSRYE